ncbi:MAG: Mini-ribonuclease 3 [Eubacteriales bacterium]
MKEFMEELKKKLNIEEYDLRTYSPLVLAFIGDAVYELLVRTKIVAEGNAPVHKLHYKSSGLVKAKTQAIMMQRIEEFLKEEEINIYKRGRNAKSGTNPKNVSVTEYRIATGFEALVGYLYLKEDYSRMIDLIKIGLESL